MSEHVPPLIKEILTAFFEEYPYPEFNGELTDTELSEIVDREGFHNQFVKDLKEYLKSLNIYKKYRNQIHLYFSKDTIFGTLATYLNSSPIDRTELPDYTGKRKLPRVNPDQFI